MTVAICVRDVSIGWSRDAILLEHATFDVQVGEIFGILGRSASGKSTLLRAIIGLEQPLAGTIELLVDGRALRPAGSTSGRRCGVVEHAVPNGPPPYGVMFQGGALFGSMSVGDNIALPLQRWTRLPADAIAAIVRAKLRLVGLDGTEAMEPSELSGGMRKRAAIARALVLEPSILFLDEPSSGLDPITSAEIDRLISTLAHTIGLTVVVVTHELGSIDSIVDRCVVLDPETRRIIASGRPRELHHSPNPHVQHFFGRVPEGEDEVEETHA